MAKQPIQFEEIGRLTGLLLEDALTADACRRLEQMLLADPAALDYYQRYIEIHSLLHWQYCPSDEKQCEGGKGVEGQEERTWAEAHDPASPWDFLDPVSEGSANAAASSAGLPGNPPIVIDVSSPFPHPEQGLSLASYFSQVGPFSYLVSALLMCVAALGAWQYELADRPECPPYGYATTRFPAPIAPRSVGQVTDLHDIRWTGMDAPEEERPASQSANLSLTSRVPLRRKVQIDSGVLEITFDTGAIVLLQGPATFEAEANGGFLSIGKLTGRMEKAAGSHSPSTSGPFAIRTPSAVVTDLGTEFGVEVDRDGYTTSHVFRGAVQVRPVVLGQTDEAVTLNKDESVRVEVFNKRVPVFDRNTIDPSRFVRPAIGNRRIPIRAFGTGANLEGVFDRNWQVVSVSSIPDFQPKAANLAGTASSWLVHAPGQSQWITTFIDPDQPLPSGAMFTFRTTFELDNVVLETAVMRGWFLTNGHVDAVRLNGRSVQVPEHDRMACRRYQKFSLNRGLVEGTNVLELDVAKAPYSMRELPNPMISICVDLEGTVQKK